MGKGRRQLDAEKEAIAFLKSHAEPFAGNINETGERFGAIRVFDKRDCFTKLKQFSVECRRTAEARASGKGGFWMSAISLLARRAGFCLRRITLRFALIPEDN